MRGDLQAAWKVVRQRDFSGGENLNDQPDSIAANQFAQAENVMITPEGYLTDAFQMDSIALYSPTGRDLRGIVFDQMPSTSQYNYYHTSGLLVDTVYTNAYNTAATTATNTDDDTAHTCTGSSISGLSLAVHYLGKRYCINHGGGVLNLTDFTVIKTGNLLTMPLVKLTTYANRLWGVTTTGELIFSGNGDATTWDELNFIKLSAWERAIDFIPVQGGVIVYSRTSVYAMYGTDYTDISLVQLIKDVILSDGAVLLNNIVYVLGNRGIYQVTLTGIQELQHTQNKYFKAQYLAWTANETGNVQGIYLYKYHAIMYLFRSDVGAQGFIYYLTSGAIFKVNHALNVQAPYMLALEDANTDFLIYKDYAHICKSITPSGILSAPRTAVIKTAKIDLSSARSKVVREFAVTVDAAINGVTIHYYLDDATTPVTAFNGALSAGDNVFFLSIPRCHTIAFKITIIADTTHQAAFTTKEMRLKFREAGPAR